MIEERPEIAIQNIVHLGAGDPDHQRVQRIVLAALGPEPVRKPEEVFLVALFAKRIDIQAAMAAARQ